MLPRNFLIEIANKYELSEGEQEVFLKKFGSDKSDRAIALELHISDGAFRTRLSGIYRKFSISGNGPVKSNRLFRLLTQEYQKVGPLSSQSFNTSVTNLDVLVQKVRQQRHEKIQDQCGTMRMLDIAKPIKLTDIYTDVNILENIPSQQWREIPDLLQNFNPKADDFDRLGLGRVRQSRVPGLDAVSRYSKVILLGKPGAGKTTFLQWVAIKCDSGEFQSNRVPIFIRLKNLAEDTREDNSEFKIFNYINEEFNSCGIGDKSFLELLLTQGLALIMLDGLDEVSEEDEQEIVNKIRRFVNKYFKNQYIITCRIAVQRYKFSRENFTEVEVTDFNDKQIEVFTNNWFVAVNKNNQDKEETIAKRFLERLKMPENQQIRELAVTPILLNLTCLVFNETGKFPLKRSKLYEQGLDILLRKWDEERGIKRDAIHCILSVENKIELLTYVAFITFKKDNYFFEKSKIERYIAEYFSTLTNHKTDILTLQNNSKAVLEFIVAQHGLLVERARDIYSFSHLTFQEYFTARAVINSFKAESLRKSVSYITNKSWREVFLLASGMMPNANELILLMKQRIDAIVASDEKLQQFLDWVNQKSIAVCSFSSTHTRAFYFALAGRHTRTIDFTIAEDFALARDLGFSNKLHQPESILELEYALDFALDYALDCAVANAFDPKSSLERARNIAYDLLMEIEYTELVDSDDSDDSDYDSFDSENAYDTAGDRVYSNDFFMELEELGYELIDEEFWWRTNGDNWIKKLRFIMVKYRNIGHDWQFNKQQKELIQQFLYANKLLVNCMLNSTVTYELQKEVENTLVLSIAEIQKLKD